MAKYKAGIFFAEFGCNSTMLLALNAFKIFEEQRD
jgi:hypothetical protein